MPVGELIAAAVGLILIIIVAYVLVGSTIGTAETMASAQRDMTHLQVVQLHTDIAITSTIATLITPQAVPFNITNTGIEAVDLRYVDVFIINQTTNKSTQYSSVLGNGILNPKGVISGSIPLYFPDICDGASPSPYSIEVVTGKGYIISAILTVNNLGH